MRLPGYVSVVLVHVCLLAGAGGALAAGSEPATRSMSFTNDVLPVLSKHGCNSGKCHGRAIGQNGFRLSLYGFDPESDYAALVHEGRGRRVSLAAPRDSFVLLKATGAVAHGGGARFDDQSQPYRLLLEWIEQGAPWGDADEPRVVAIDVEPGEVLAKEAGGHQIRVSARYSDGTTRDVTETARYDSQTPALLAVDERGRVTTTGEPGDGVVMVRYRGLVGAARFTAPFEPAAPAEAYAGFVPKNFIDELVLAKWRRLGLAPSPDAGDAQFMRRVYLDAMGMLPTPEEVRQFTADEDPDKRDKLAAAVLERDEFADHWAHRWGELLRNREGDGAQHRPQTINFATWLRESIRENKPYDQFARQLLTVSGKIEDHPQIDWYRQVISQPARVEDTSQVFLGLRVSCANCHDHPFESISQDDYWSFAAFFARVGSPTYGAVKMIELNEKGKVQHPRTTDEMTPRPYGGPAFEFVEGEDPRVKLADWMTAADNPYFARAISNRVFGHYMKVGLVDAVDDMRATNPPSNPALLDALAKDFVEHGYDVKRLMRSIMTSRVYGLSSTPTQHNARDTRNYARHDARRLSPVVLMDAIASATGVPDTFKDYPEAKRAIQLPNEKPNSDLLDIFGRSNRDTPCECETRLDPNLAQVLYLLNSDELQRKIAHKEGIIAKLVEADTPTDEAVTRLFLRTFSRAPHDDELKDAVALVEAASDRKHALEDLLWTLANSKEFLFNH